MAKSDKAQKLREGRMPAGEDIIAACHCGAVRWRLDSLPADVTDCNCSICQRYGTLWAYCSPASAHRLDAGGCTDTYMWDDRSIAFHRCQNCGCVTHWAAVDPAADRMGINARMLPLDLLSGIRVRHLDGAVTERYVEE
jgi:hypothetical protein